MLNKVRVLGVKIDVRDNRLLVDAPKGVLTESLIEDIKKNKELIIQFFNQALDSEGFESINSVEQNDYYDLSFAQNRLWLIHEIVDNKILYNQPRVFKVKGSLEKAAFIFAAERLMERHEMLRTNFLLIDDKPKQKIKPLNETSPDIRFHDLSGGADHLQRMINNEVNTPFNLLHDTLIRFRVWQISPGECAILIMTHHIISDLWSMNIMIREFQIFYDSYCLNVEPSLKPLDIQYKDFAAWQNQKLESGKWASGMAYWKEILNEKIQPLALETDFQRPAISNHVGDKIKFEFDNEFSNAVSRLRTKYEVSSFVILLAAVQVLLYRYSHQKNFMIGSPFAGRDHAQLENQIGLYVNTLVFKSDLRDNMTFGSLVDVVNKTVEKSFAFKDIPFDMLVQELRLKRDLSSSPLFDVMLVLQHVEDDTIVSSTPFGKLEFTTYQKDFFVSKFDLTFIFSEAKNKVNFSIEYNVEIFASSTVAQLGNHLKSLLCAFSRFPEGDIVGLDIFPANERIELGSLLPKGPHQTWSYRSFTEHFEEQVAQSTLSLAVHDSNTSMTYDQLNKLANQLSAFLQQQPGYSDQQFVGVSMENSAWLVVALMAILKSGKAFVTIDARYPMERKGHIVTDCNLKFMIMDRSDDDIPLLSPMLQVVCLDAKSNEELSLFKYDSKNYSKIKSPESLAYAIYTSGSSGVPKGITIRENNFGNYLSWANEYYFQNQKGHHFALCTSISFDLTFTSIFSTLLRGDTVFVYKVSADLADTLYHVLSHPQVKVIKLTPSMVNIINDLNINSMAVEKVILGGEALRPEHVQILQKANNRIQIFNEYGPTETTVGVSVKKIEDSANPISIGRPISNTSILIVNEQLELVPKGVRGEILIGGASVGEGYINNPKLTSEKFINIPLEDGLWYRSGDSGKWLANGEIMYLGRLDSQLKIRGHLIELDEVTSRLKKCPGVHDAVVLGVSQAQGENVLVAYYEGLQGIVAIDITTYLSRYLPAYMIPSFFVPISKIPINSNGKVDVQALHQQPIPSAGDGEKEIMNETEEKVASIWKDLLNLESVGLNTNFFEAGGHSLRAIQLRLRMQKAFGVNLTLANIFTFPTIALQASYIARGESYRNENLYEISPATFSPEGIYPVSHGQKRLWFIHKLSPDSFAYNMSFQYKLKGVVDKVKIEEAFQALIERHEILRTCFFEINGSPMQKVLPSVGCKVGVTEHVLNSREEGALKEYLQQRRSHSFALESWPLFKIDLFQISEKEFMLSMVIHHIICDGWSRRIIENEFLQNYYDILEGRQPNLERLPVQYKDYSQWQIMQGTEEDRNYWINMLSGIDGYVKLPFDRERKSKHSFEGKKVSFTVKSGEKLSLEAIASENRSSLSNVVLSIFGLLLHQVSQQDSIHFGVAVAGRNHLQVENLIGFFVNTIICRIEFSKLKTFEELVQCVTKNLVKGIDHQNFPFDQLVEAINPDRNGYYQPVFNIMYAFQNYRNVMNNPGGSSIPQQSSAPVVIPFNSTGSTLETSKFDLTLYVMEMDDEIEFVFQYDAQLFNDTTLMRFADIFKKFIATASTNRISNTSS